VSYHRIYPRCVVPNVAAPHGRADPDVSPKPMADPAIPRKRASDCARLYPGKSK